MNFLTKFRPGVSLRLLLVSLILITQSHTSQQIINIVNPYSQLDTNYRNITEVGSLRHCLRQIPDGALKCAKHFRENLVFIQTSQAIEESSQKRLMFCCSIWQWRACNLDLARFRCSVEGVYAIETYPTYVPVWGEKTAQYCQEFPYGTRKCNPYPFLWTGISIVAVAIAAVLGLCVAFRYYGVRNKSKKLDEESSQQLNAQPERVRKVRTVSEHSSPCFHQEILDKAKKNNLLQAVMMTSESDVEPPKQRGHSFDNRNRYGNKFASRQQSILVRTNSIG